MLRQIGYHNVGSLLLLLLLSQAVRLLQAAGKGNRQQKVHVAAEKFYGLLELFFCTSRFSYAKPYCSRMGF